MPDSSKSKKALLEELQTLRSRVAELERMENEYKRTEQALRESQERYVRAEQIGHFGHWERNLVEDKATWSEESYHIFGVDPNKFEPAYESFLDLVHPCDRDRVKREFEAAGSHGKRFDIEYRIVRPDGAERILRSVAEVRFDKSGRALSLVGTAHDITERKQTEQELRKAHDELERHVEERTATLSKTNVLLKDQIAERKQANEALRQSEEKWRSLVENAPDVILTVGPDGTILFLNHTVPPFTPEKAVGTSIYDYVPAEYQDTLRKSLEHVLQTGEPYSYELAGKGPHGRTSWYQCRMGPIKHGGQVVAVILIATDITEHKRAEGALRESENKYRTLLENLPQKIFLKDRNSVYLSCNENLAGDLKIRPEEIAGKTDYDFVPRELAERYRADDKRVVESGETKDIEEAYIQEGQQTIIHTLKTPVKDEQGNVIGILGIFWDITERKRAEDALRESEERLRLALSAADMGTWRWDPVINQDTRDASFNRILGLSAAESTQPVEDFLQRVHPDDRDMVDKEIQCSIRDRRPYLAEFRIVRPDGAIRWLRDQGKVLCDENDRVSYMTGAVVDITERKRAEDTLKESEERYRTLFEGAAEGILVAESQTKRFKYANPAICQMLGYPEEELKRMGVRDIHPKEDLEHAISEFDAQAKGEKTLTPSIPCLRKDGTIMYADINAALVVIDGRQYNVGFFTDITERRKAEEALQKAHDELEARVEQRTAELARANEQLLSLASELSLAEERLRRRIATDVHDHIGQNLAISKIKLESLRESMSSPELAVALDEIRELIAQTIESSRSLTFELSPPVLYELGFEAAVEWLVRQTRQQHGLSAEFKSDGRSKPLSHDVSVLLFQAVRELLVNVAKHAQAQNVTVSTRRVADEIQVTVEDDGVGFDTSKTTSRDYETGGFGLFSIRERLRSIGGRFDIESRPGVGTRVTLAAHVDNGNEDSGEKRK